MFSRYAISDYYLTLGRSVLLSRADLSGGPFPAPGTSEVRLRDTVHSATVRIIGAYNN